MIRMFCLRTCKPAYNETQPLAEQTGAAVAVNKQMYVKVSSRCIEVQQM